MPTYDYRCAACGHDLEVFQSIRDPVLKKCPKCGRSKLERLIGPGAGILFKGKGFYQTDYRTESYKQGESAEKGASQPASAETSSAKPSSSEAGAGKPTASEAKPSKPEKGPAKSPGKKRG